MYGIREDDYTGKTTVITVWSGQFLGTYEAKGRAQNGARQITLTTYNEDKVVVFRRIDAVISGYLQAHYTYRGRITASEPR